VLDNAAEALPEGGSITASAQASADGGVNISISDSGPGMSESVQSRCLRPFFSAREGRMGMGLTLAARLLGRHGGRLGLTAAKGIGTTVVLSLPSPRAASGNPLAALRRRPALHVLLVDDDDAARDALTAMLVRDGHRVSAVPDGAAAVLQLRQRRFDLVMTDYAMPIMTGEELALAVKARHAGTPVVLVTAAGEEMTRAGRKPEGVDAVLCKPVLRPDLLMALSRALECAEAAENSAAESGAGPAAPPG
jgi:CheY-like chemotaxis protein